MHDWNSLSHVRWDCKYHIVIVPKYRRKRLYGKFRRRVGQILRDLCRQRGVEILEGHLMADHVHTGLHFWSRGYCVSTVGLDERTVREYIRKQEEIEKRQIEMELE